MSAVQSLPYTVLFWSCAFAGSESGIEQVVGLGLEAIPQDTDAHTHRRAQGLEWANGAGSNCADYEMNGWCAMGSFTTSGRPMGAPDFQDPKCTDAGDGNCARLYNYPAQNCAECGASNGSSTAVPLTATPTTTTRTTTYNQLADVATQNTIIPECDGGAYQIGDGTGGHEQRIGDALTPEQCVAMVQSDCPGANGATLPSQGSGGCYCEFGMTGRYGTTWQSCTFVGEACSHNVCAEYECMGCEPVCDVEVYRCAQSSSQPGADIGGMRVLSFDSCAMSCCETPGCMGYDHFPNGNSCYLSSADRTAVPLIEGQGWTSCELPSQLAFALTRTAVPLIASHARPLASLSLAAIALMSARCAVFV